MADIFGIITMTKGEIQKMLDNRLSVRLNQETYNALKDQANEIGVNVSILARAILEKGAKEKWKLSNSYDTHGESIQN